MAYLWLWAMGSLVTYLDALSVDLGRRGAAGQERPKALRRPVPRQSLEAMPGAGGSKGISNLRGLGQRVNRRERRAWSGA